MSLKIRLYESKEEKCNIPEKYLDSDALIDLLEFSCIMQIEIDGVMYLDEGICPLEMRYAIKNWLNKINRGNACDFNYITEDDSKNPVLKFSFNGARYNINSVHQIYNCNKSFSLNDLKNFCEQFELELKKFIIS